MTPGAVFVQTFGHFVWDGKLGDCLMSDNYGLIYCDDTLCTIPTPPTPLPDSQGGYYCTGISERYFCLYV